MNDGVLPLEPAALPFSNHKDVQTAACCKQSWNSAYPNCLRYILAVADCDGHGGIVTVAKCACTELHHRQETALLANGNVAQHCDTSVLKQTVHLLIGQARVQMLLS